MKKNETRDIRSFLQECSERTKKNLECYYRKQQGPRQLIEAIKYSSLGNGKMIRPGIIYATAQIYDLPTEKIDGIACATELMHAYSLIHDDLPAMDDDDFRRGQPSLHKRFGEALAILAGDAMHAMAFELLVSSTNLTQQEKIEVINILAHAAGTAGMSGGQAMDVTQHRDVDIRTVEKIHRLKTGALIKACVLMVSSCNQSADAGKHEALRKFSDDIGLCFQIRDDLLDVEPDREKRKQPGEKTIKLTYPSVLGYEKANRELLNLRDLCLGSLEALDHRAQTLRELTRYVAERPV